MGGCCRGSGVVPTRSSSQSTATGRADGAVRALRPGLANDEEAFGGPGVAEQLLASLCPRIRHVLREVQAVRRGARPAGDGVVGDAEQRHHPELDVWQLPERHHRQ